MKGDPRRGPGRPFKPGQSGNPGGQPKGLVRLIREETRAGAELAELLIRVLRAQEPETTLRDRIAAATWLADRAFGRAPLDRILGDAPHDPDEAARELFNALPHMKDARSPEELRDILAGLDKPCPACGETL